MASRPRTRLVAFVATVLVLLGAAAGCSKDEDDAKRPDATSRTTSDEARTTGTTGGTTGATTTNTVANDPNPDVPEVGDAEQPYVDALVSTYEASDSEIYSKRQIECLAARWVPIIGVDTFEKEGIRPADLGGDSSALNDLNVEEGTAREMVAAMPRCGIDLVGSIVSGMVGAGASDEQRACVLAAVDRKAVEEAMVKSFMGEDTGTDSAFAGAEKCLTVPGASSSSTSAP